MCYVIRVRSSICSFIYSFAIGLERRTDATTRRKIQCVVVGRWTLSKSMVSLIIWTVGTKRSQGLHLLAEPRFQFPPESAKAEANGSLALHVRQTECAEYVRRFRNASRTCCAGRCRESRLKDAEDVLRLATFKADVGIARMASLADRSVDADGEFPIF